MLSKKTKIAFVCILLLSILLQMSVTAWAAPVERNKVKLTSFKVTNTGGKVPPDGIPVGDVAMLKIEWDAREAYKYQLHEGDYFIVNLPKGFKFPDIPSATRFPLKTSDGVHTVANAVVSPDPAGGGTIRATFTNYVEGKENVFGNMVLNANFNTTIVKPGENNTFTVSVGTNIASDTVMVKKHVGTVLQNEVLKKWAGQMLTEEGYTRWTLRLNHKKDNLTDVKIVDKVWIHKSTDSTGIEYIDGQFTLSEVEMDETGATKRIISTKNVSAQVQISPDKRSFTYELGDISGKQYMFHYRTTYIKGVTLSNIAELYNGGVLVDKKPSGFKSADSGGSGTGENSGKIKIIKTDADNPALKLADAEFLITKLADQSSFKLKTNAGGEAVSQGLAAGKYKIKEISAPAGYLLNTNERTIDVKKNETNTQTFTNNKIATANITGRKAWEGGPSLKPAIYLVLLRSLNGSAATAVTGTLSRLDSGITQKVWMNMPSTDAAGNPYIYSVKEVDAHGNDFTPANYVKSENGLLVKNRFISPKTSIDVEKKWVGEPAAKALITLMADGVNVQMMELNATNNWRGSFVNLDRFRENGTEIVYQVSEQRIEGYSSSISGDAGAGFVITNTKRPIAPKTGDGMNLQVYMGILAVSFFGFVVIFGTKGIKKKTNR